MNLGSDHPQRAIIAARVRHLRWLCRWQWFWQAWTSALLVAMFAAGALILAGRCLALPTGFLLAAVAAGGLGALAYAGNRLRRTTFDDHDVAAWLDCHGHGGGLLMTAFSSGYWSGWEERVEQISLPRAHARLGPGLLSLLAALAFPLLCGLLPLPDSEAAAASAPARLDLDQPVAAIDRQLDLLAEVRLLTPERRQELSKAIQAVAENTAALQPGKVYESLDAMESALRRLAEEGCRNLAVAARSMEELELAAEQLAITPDPAAERLLRTRAEQFSAMLEGQPLPGNFALPGNPAPDRICAEYLKASPPAGAEQLRRLVAAMRQCRGDLGKTMSRLLPSENAAALKALNARLDAEGRLSGAGALFVGGVGGVDRGRGDAPMFFGDESPALSQPLTPEKLTADALRADLNETLGTSFSAPEAQPVDDRGQGHLATDAGHGGEARRMRIAPADRDLVRRYFAQPGE